MSQRQQQHGQRPARDTLFESEAVVALVRTLIVAIVLLAPAVVGLRRSPAYYQASVVALLYALSIDVLLWRRIDVPYRRQLQLAIDVVLLTGLVHQDQELRPEVFPFYYLVVLSGASWLGVPGAIAAAALASLGSTVAVAFFVPEVTRFDQLQSVLLPQVLQIFMVAVLGANLAEAWRAEREAASGQRAIVEEFRQQINMARELQSILLPASLPRVPGLDLGVRARQADVVVGGDFYDGVAFPDGSLAVCCADVSGKSVSGQLRLPLVKYAFRVCASELREPAEVLARLDRLLYDELPPEMFVSLVYVLLEPRESRLVIGNAGGLPPLHLAARTGKVTAVSDHGLVLGLEPRERSRVTTLAFEPDDYLLLYTDGVTEAKGRRGRMLDLDGLVGLLEGTTPESAQDLCNLLFQSLEEYEIGAKSDDLTLLALRRTVTS